MGGGGYSGLHLFVRPFFRPSLPSFPPSPFWWNLSSKISQQPCKLECSFIFGMQVDDNFLYRGFENQPSPLIYPFNCPIFFASILWWNISSKISQQPCKLECSYLVCRLMMTYCILGLRTSLLLLIFTGICPIFFPSILWRMTFFV